MYLTFFEHSESIQTSSSFFLVDFSAPFYIFDLNFSSFESEGCDKAQSLIGYFFKVTLVEAVGST